MTVFDVHVQSLNNARTLRKREKVDLSPSLTHDFGLKGCMQQLLSLKWFSLSNFYMCTFSLSYTQMFALTLYPAL